ncbi:MAG: tetratricopeptide repeat protein, partial [Bacteroidetes bacterium]|nr:tetratricopeptide repeat protein [Bacteroidota bacterium]
MKAETEYYDEAHEFIITGRYDEALEMINEGLSVYPNSASLFYKRGRLYDETKDFEKAIQNYNLAMQKDPKAAYPENGIGIVYFIQEKYEQAIEHFNLAIKKDPKDAASEHGLGNVYYEQKNFDKAIEHYTLAIQKGPDLAHPEHGLGNVYSERKDFDLAIRHYTLAIQKDPDFANPENGLGDVYRKQKDFDLAIRHCTLAIQKDPKDAYYENGVGNVYYDLKDFNQAIEHYTRAIQMDPDFARPELGLGSVYYDLKDFDKAIEHLTQAIQKDPKYATPEYGLGNVYADLKDFDKAIEHLTMAIKKDPNDGASENRLGNVYLNQKDFDKAIEHYTQAIQKDPDLAHSELGLGSVYYERKQFGVAIIHFTRFVFLDKDKVIKSRLRPLLSIFVDEIPSPFLARYILGENVGDLPGLSYLIARNRAQCELVQLYLDYLRYYRVNEQTQLTFQYTLALTNYYMGLPFESYRIFNDEKDSCEAGISMLGNYYWLLSATAFAVPDNSYKILKQNALDKIKELLKNSDEAPPRELYYAGLICWNEYLANDLPEMATQADQLFGLAEDNHFLPAIYMRAVTLGAKGKPTEQAQQIELIKNLEDSNADGPIYLMGFETTTLDPVADDFLVPILRYAHFIEIYEAIELVNDGAFAPIPEFYNTWEISDKETIKAKVNTAQLNELKNSLINTLVENVGDIYDDLRAETLRESISDINNTLENSIHRLFTNWDGLHREDGYSTQLEYNLATFIHAWETGNAVIHEGKKVAGRVVYEKFIAYFLLKGVLEPLAAFALTYYAFFIEDLHRPKRFHGVFSDSSAEGVTDLGKESLADVGKIVITSTFEIGMVSLSPITFFVGFTVKAILQHRVLFMAECSPKLSAKDDYNKFKEILDENTLKL